MPKTETFEANQGRKRSWGCAVRCDSLTISIPVVSMPLCVVIVSFGFCGIIAIAGKRGSAPTMVLSRAAFGTQGNKIPGVISWIACQKDTPNPNMKAP
jgi:hypothetical protein